MPVKVWIPSPPPKRKKEKGKSGTSGSKTYLHELHSDLSYDNLRIHLQKYFGLILSRLIQSPETSLLNSQPKWGVIKGGSILTRILRLKRKKQLPPLGNN